ncbi:hypothetical protein HDU92_007429 [Lobulomyces angularis]|nr:hypothetical protein HDU92_007429 [Lobulomyces angularis]
MSIENQEILIDQFILNEVDQALKDYSYKKKDSKFQIDKNEEEEQKKNEKEKMKKVLEPVVDPINKTRIEERIKNLETVDEKKKVLTDLKDKIQQEIVEINEKLLTEDKIFKKNDTFNEKIKELVVLDSFEKKVDEGIVKIESEEIKNKLDNEIDEILSNVTIQEKKKTESKVAIEEKVDFSKNNNVFEKKNKNKIENFQTELKSTPTDEEEEVEEDMVANEMDIIDSIIAEESENDIEELNEDDPFNCKESHKVLEDKNLSKKENWSDDLFYKEKDELLDHRSNEVLSDNESGEESDDEDSEDEFQKSVELESKHQRVELPLTNENKTLGEEVMDSILNPGFSPKMQIYMNLCFAGLFTVLIGLLILTGGDINALFLIVVNILLCGSMNW